MLKIKTLNWDDENKIGNNINDNDNRIDGSNEVNRVVLINCPEVKDIGTGQALFLVDDFKFPANFPSDLEILLEGYLNKGFKIVGRTKQYIKLELERRKEEEERKSENV
jgi:hypothetical protein